MKNKWGMICGVMTLGILLVSCGRTPGTVNAELPELKGGNEGATRTGVPLHRTPLGKQFSKVLFYSGPSDQKVAALTFDGPDVKFTPQILDILKQHGIKATFFIVGERAFNFRRWYKESYVRDMLSVTIRGTIRILSS